MSPDQIEDARRAIERVRDDLGESRVRAGRDHEVLEAARWAASLLREMEPAHLMLQQLATVLESRATSVRQLHCRIADEQEAEFCGYCSDLCGQPVPYPCDTTHALDPHVVKDERWLRVVDGNG